MLCVPLSGVRVMTDEQIRFAWMAAEERGDYSEIVLTVCEKCWTGDRSWAPAHLRRCPDCFATARAYWECA